MTEIMIKLDHLIDIFFFFSFCCGSGVEDRRNKKEEKSQVLIFIGTLYTVYTRESVF